MKTLTMEELFEKHKHQVSMNKYLTLTDFKDAITEDRQQIKDITEEMIVRAKDNWYENLPWRGGYIDALTQLLTKINELK